MEAGERTAGNGHGRGNRIVAIEGLRGFAMTLVFFGHFEGLFRGYLPAGSISLPVLDFLGVIAHQGVCFFLTLSGYFVYRAYLEDPGGAGAFALRRVRRVYPPYLAMLGLYLALSLLYPAESKVPSGAAAIWYIAANLLMISTRPVITVSWTIGTLIALYTVVPLFWRSVRYQCWHPVCRIGFILGAGALWLSTPQHYPLLEKRGVFILAGFTLYEAVRSGAKFLPRGELPALAILGCGYILWYAAGHEYLRFITTHIRQNIAQCIFLLPGFFYICGHVTDCRGRLAHWLEGAGLPGLGRIGYSYYLCHGLTLKVLLLALQSLWPGTWHSTTLFWAALPVAYACTLGSAWAWFQLVEVDHRARVPDRLPRTRTARVANAA
jgi:peptidoglycan/LPS O-acetylase OafA/YrhL